MTMSKIFPILLTLIAINIGGLGLLLPEKLKADAAQLVAGLGQLPEKLIDDAAQVIGGIGQLPENLKDDATQVMDGIGELPEKLKDDVTQLLVSKFPFITNIANLLQTLFGLIFGTSLPEIDTDKWWGDGERQNQDTSVREFRVTFNETGIDDFIQGLKNHRPFTKTLQGIESQYGMNVDFFQEVLDYVIHDYDFKKREDLMNQYPRYKTNIQGLDIQFIHVKPKVACKEVNRIMMVHGWPSHSWEFFKVIDLLVTPKENIDCDLVFEVIAVDLPGFAFSQGTTKPGLDPVYMAVILKQLMDRLGFSKFYIQAGDWGSQICSILSVIYPDSVLGLHLNFALSLKPITLVKMLVHALWPNLGDPVLAERTYPLSNLVVDLLEGTGFWHIQATKPDTIGLALTDSPVGCTAYILEKFGVLTNRYQLDTKHGGVANLNLDEVIDMIYLIWDNKAITSSMRLYKEAFAVILKHLAYYNADVKVPMCAINYRYETLYQSKSMLRDRYKYILRSTVIPNDTTGHFAALQNPEGLTQDIYECVADVRRFRQYNHLD